MKERLTACVSATDVPLQDQGGSWLGSALRMVGLSGASGRPEGHGEQLDQDAGSSGLTPEQLRAETITAHDAAAGGHDPSPADAAKAKAEGAVNGARQLVGRPAHSKDGVSVPDRVTGSPNTQQDAELHHFTSKAGDYPARNEDVPEHAGLTPADKAR